MEGKLHGRVALITGTGGGQGRAAALRFAIEGAIVVGCDVDAATSERTVELVNTAGGTMTASAPLDLSDPDAAKTWVDSAAGEHGRIDILYNNAGACRFGLLKNLSDEDWHFTTRNEIDIVFYVTRAAWPYLARSPHASIIITASMTGIVAQNLPGGSAHALAKHGLIGLTRQLASEGSADGIRVNAISPGPIVVPTTAPFVDEMEPIFLERLMIKRLGLPDDIAGPALFLASDDAGYVTGANLVVDGGYTAA
jgi:NAD(P)-dependent dehydrogenase (short-subunit alcohol dehydrogenase family)